MNSSNNNEDEQTDKQTNRQIHAFKSSELSIQRKYSVSPRTWFSSISNFDL